MLRVETAIQRVHRGNAVASALKVAFFLAIVGCLLIGPTFPKLLALGAVLFAWIWLSFTSARGSQIVADSPSLIASGQYEEAEQRFAQARELPDNTPITQAYWRQAAALVASHRDEHAEAERLARKALTYTQKTDSPKLQADAYCDLAEVLEVAGGRQEALLMWHEALDRYERKGVIPLARRVRARLAALERMPSSQGLDDAVP